jgi:hypothetical protein
VPISWKAEEIRLELIFLAYLFHFFFETNEKKIKNLTLFPFKIENFRLNYCSQEELNWVFNVLKRESKIDGSFKKKKIVK